MTAVQTKEEKEDKMGGESWVCCDTCEKWRRIPAELASSLKEEDSWYGTRIRLSNVNEMNSEI